jgi:hypothetical protein
MNLRKETMFISFSGGRTSGYMCHWLLENKSDEYDFIFVFANTGLEHEKTLDFVDQCDKHMGLNLVWVEGVAHYDERQGSTHNIVDYKTASRKGEPFESVIKKYGIPNMDYPHCTRELKTNPMQSYKASLGFARKHPMAIGIRADEIDRISPTAKENGLIYPLVIWTQSTMADVRHWWSNQDYDLDIPEHHGNCLTCWKKSDRKLWTIAKYEPEWFEFFDRMEKTYPDAGAGDQSRVFFRGYRSAQDILKESQQPFTEFKDQMPPLQSGLFPSIDIEEDCGAGCEIT